jgi:putative flippase GtrA
MHDANVKQHFYRESTRVASLKIKYVTVGGIKTLIGLSAFPFLFWILDSVGIHYLCILIISQIICVTTAFVLYKLLVFKTDGDYLKEFVKFASFYLVYFLSGIALLPFLVEVAGIHPILSQFLISIGIIISSFFWHSKITFANVKNESKDNP